LSSTAHGGGRVSRVAKAAVEESGETPLEYMIRVMRDPKANARRRDAMAAAAAPYVHHRLSSTEHSGPGDGPVQVIVQTGFAYGDDASTDAAVASKPKPKSLHWDGK
jgi:hypothetical protein